MVIMHWRVPEGSGSQHPESSWLSSSVCKRQQGVTFTCWAHAATLPIDSSPRPRHRAPFSIWSCISDFIIEPILPLPPLIVGTNQILAPPEPTLTVPVQVKSLAGTIGIGLS